jgi:hypothetical protein
MAKKNEVTRNELIELVELLLDHVRNDRYRELMDKYDNDETVDKIAEELTQNPGERVVVGG